MPNMAAKVGAAMSAYSVDIGSGDFDEDEVVNLLLSIGEVEKVEEEWMDLVTAVSGSGPAYFFLMVEALEKAAVNQGLPGDVAKELSRETLWGAAKVLKETGQEACELREAVSSPGGTTLAALRQLEKSGFDEAIGLAVEAAKQRSEEISRSHD
jgi:pyrroline-5-carboxylate reductase